MMSKKEEEKKQKSLKNYLILVGCFVLMILLVLYIDNWYKVYSDYQKETPIIRGTLTYEIKGLDFDHYILENPSCFIYMCTSSSDRCRDFEKDFKKLIEKKHLQNAIIYLNLSDSNLDTFVTRFNQKYRYKVKLTKDYPALVEFTDGKVTALIEGTEKENLTIAKVNQFVDLHHVGEVE